MPRSSRNSAKEPANAKYRVGLVHWNASEANERVELLADLGFDVAPVISSASPGFMKLLREEPPSALLIDLSRLPSHGRDVAMAVREQRGTRMIPLVFVEGEWEKVEAVRRGLPDAAFATWREIKAAVREAIAHAPAEPIVPKSRLDGYSGTPLPKKLGIKANFKVELVDAPTGFEAELGDVEAGATLKRKKLRSLIKTPSKDCDLALWFVHSIEELAAGSGHFAQHCPTGGVWFIWQKKAAKDKLTARPKGDEVPLTERDVRETGLAAGLVDFKICAVTMTWSGLKFTLRKRTSNKRTNS